MRIKRFQNKVAESRYTLPLTSILALVVCLSGGMFTNGMWVQFALLVLASYLMMELNNVNALIRIYSRMVSCSFLALTVMSYFLFDDVSSCVLAVCLVAFYLFLFSAYQDKNAVGRVFYAFLSIGVASIFFVKILYFIPILWLLMFTNINCGSARTMVASIMGLMLPYWFIGGYCLLDDSVSDISSHFEDLVSVEELAQWQELDVNIVVTIVFVAVLSVLGMVHFRLNNYKDKIRTRMLFEFFSVMDVFILLFMILQPEYADELLALLLVSTSPLVGHYLALTHTFLTNMSFYVILVVTLCLTIVNIWIV